MYCPKCELEIKGEDKQECPICGGALTDQSDSTASEQDAAPEDDQKLQELIEDIDQKVKQNLGVDSDREGEELQLSEMNLEKDEGVEMPEDELLSSGIDADEKEQPSGMAAESEGDINDIIGALKEETGVDTSDLEKQLEDIVVPDEKPDEKDAEISDTIADQQIRSVYDTGEKTGTLIDDDEIMNSEGIDGSSPSGEETTQDILDKALDDLESDQEPRKKRSTMPALIILLALAVVGGGGYYYYTTLQDQQTVQEAVVPQNKKPAREKPVKKAQTADTKETARTVVKDEAPPPAAVKAPEKTKEAAKQAEPDSVQKKTAEAKTDLTPVKETPKPSATASQPAEKKETQAAAPVKKKTVTEKPAADTPEAIPAAKKVVKKQPEVAKPAGPTYSVHAGSYRKKTVAESEVSRLANKGYKAYLSSVDLGTKGEWHRVKIGRFTTKKEAQSVLSKIRREETIPSRIVRNR